MILSILELPLTRLFRPILLVPVLTALGCATTDSAASAPSAPARPTAPAELAPPASATLVMQLAAKGTQNYKCQSTSTGGAEWKLVAPEANLYRNPEAAGEIAGTHGAGPTWTLMDGSGARGDAAAAKKAASPEGGSIPWLLLPAQSNGQPGGLQGVTFVQRLDTHGGAAPATGCDAASVGAETKVPYTANYVFYR